MTFLPHINFSHRFHGAMPFISCLHDSCAYFTMCPVMSAASLPLGHVGIGMKQFKLGEHSISVVTH